ncbi:MAG: ABC transporter permease [Clostridia bacterium]|jgi:ABC-2 type transport system permease protein|nr:ABC transporter permease [Clostridia bacterium]MBQ4366250.1 ABC transporter permease [Clostridia bacterium]MBR3094364.1 ABC transporter permease [Clostridia bacterium]
MKYRFLLRELVNKNIKLQYRSSVLGIFWTFLQPLLTMIVLAFVFMNVFGKDSSKVVNYPVYLLCGRLLFNFYTTATKRAMTSIRRQSSMIKKVYVPKYIYPLSAVLSSFVTFLISLTVLVVVILFFNLRGMDPISVTWRVVYIIVPILITLVLSLGVGMILATVSVFFKDVENLYDVFCLLLFYLTPIVYHPSRLNFVEGSLQLRILKLNPLYGLVGMFRAAVIWGKDFSHNWDMVLMYYTSIFAVVMLVVGFWLFYRYQDKFILHI